MRFSQRLNDRRGRDPLGVKHGGFAGETPPCFNRPPVRSSHGPKGD